MPDQIYVDSNATSARVIKVGGTCYVRSGISEHAPNVKKNDITNEYEICDFCSDNEGSSESSASDESVDCSKWGDARNCGDPILCHYLLETGHAVTTSCSLKCCLGIDDPGASGVFILDGRCFQYTDTNSFYSDCEAYIIEEIPC